MEINGTINGQSFSERETHQCTSYMEGEWIVWRCPICCDPGNTLEPYERRLNWKTGKMIPPKSKNINISHQGARTGDSSIDVVQPLTKNLGEN